MLEPRRLAARQVAERMSTMLGENVGKTIGYRIRFESKVSKDTDLINDMHQILPLLQEGEVVALMGENGCGKNPGVFQPVRYFF